MNCKHRWKTISKGRSWMCRKCKKVQTKHGDVTTLEAMRDLIRRK